MQTVVAKSVFYPVESLAPVSKMTLDPFHYFYVFCNLNCSSRHPIPLSFSHFNPLLAYIQCTTPTSTNFSIHYVWVLILVSIKKNRSSPLTLTLPTLPYSLPILTLRHTPHLTLHSHSPPRHRHRSHKLKMWKLVHSHSNF